MPVSPLLIDNEKKLSFARDDIESSSFLGFDTEYDSFRYFREKLCLIQACTGENTYIFDPFEVCDISFLGDVFRDPQKVKVVHAGSSDIRLLNRDYGFEFKGLFDTHRAAGLLGNTYLSLSHIVETYIHIDLEKSRTMQRSRWDRRPLSEEQMSYAAKDTTYLIPLYLCLNEELKKNGLVDRATNIFEDLARSKWKPKQLDPQGYLRLKGAETLGEKELSRLRCLYFWRFDHARKTDRARFMILTDAEILALAKSFFPYSESLEETGVISERKTRELGPLLANLLSRNESVMADE